MRDPLLRTDEEIAQSYETYVDMVYRLCITILKHKFDAEDAVQNTFIKLMHHNKPFASAEHEKAWLIVTATNTCKDMLRRASRQDEVLEAHESRFVAPAAEPDSTDFLSAVQALPPKYRAPVYLYYYEGYSGGEIAVLLKKPASTIRNWLLEARKQLRQQLGGDFDAG